MIKTFLSFFVLALRRRRKPFDAQVHIATAPPHAIADVNANVLSDGILMPIIGTSSLVKSTRQVSATQRICFFKCDRRHATRTRVSFGSVLRDGLLIWCCDHERSQMWRSCFFSGTGDCLLFLEELDSDFVLDPLFCYASFRRSRES
jgi:hypothetical protein